MVANIFGIINKSQKVALSTGNRLILGHGKRIEGFN